jgi:hypothetical protein
VCSAMPSCVVNAARREDGWAWGEAFQFINNLLIESTLPSHTHVQEQKRGFRSQLAQMRTRAGGSPLI